MKRSISKWLVLLAASGIVPIVAFACGDLDEYYTHGNGNTLDAGTGRFTRHMHGSAIDVSEDDTRVVVVNRDVGTITVFEPTYGRADTPLRQVKEVDKVCNDNSDGDRGEPWQVVLTPNGDTAYVVCRSAQVVSEIIGIRSEDPHPSGVRISVGSEPTGIALTPRATSAWVANWMDGTAQRIDLATKTVAQTVDLNAALVGAAGKYLGNVKARPALAHPRSVAITNDGDDDETDETLVVTEYFSQQKETLRADALNADSARVGILYKISLGSAPTVNVIELPAGEMRFDDARNERANCFPNQLQSVTINGSASVGKIFAYITSVCASPKGPLGIYSPTSQPVACTTNENCLKSSTCVDQKCTPSTNGVKTTTSPAVTVIDIQEGRAVDFGTIALNFDYWDFYAKAKLDEASPERVLPLLANDVAFLPGSFRALITAGGADALFRLEFLVAYADRPAKVSGPGAFVSMDLARETGDRFPLGPVGVVVAHAHPNAFVANDGARRVAMVDLDAGGGVGQVVGSAEATAQPSPGSTREATARGKRLFNFGLARWSMNEQGWGACAVCHVDGLTDNVTWFFPRGPRQSTSIDGFFEKDNAGAVTHQRNFGWNAALDEASDLDNNVLRNLFGGVGAIAKKPAATLSDADRIDLKNDRGLSGSSMNVPGNELEDWKDIVEFLKSVRTPRHPTGLDPASVQRGLVVARNAKCGGCHGGPLWTISRLFYAPQHIDADAGADAAVSSVNEKLKSKKWEAGALPDDVLPTTDESARTMRYAGNAGGAFDSLTCALRNVKTFATKEPDVGVAELRDNMSTRAQGESTGDVHEPSGYNPPSLFGLAVGAPYFHAGNARTLEAALSADFAAHRGALAGGPGFSLSEQERADLIVFLLAIDRSADAQAAPLLDVPDGHVLCAPP